MAKYLNREQGAADRANHGVNGIPRRVDPRNFVGEEFEKIENPGDRNNRRVAQDFERLIGRRKRDPVEMDGQSSDENGEIEVDAGQARQTERDRKEIEFLHAKLSAHAKVAQAAGLRFDSDTSETHVLHSGPCSTSV